MKRVLMAAAFASFMVPAAYADTCADAEDQATLNQCAAQEYKAADAELNTRFHEIRKRLVDDAATRGLLRDSERAWVSFRDAECTFAASATAGGTAYPMAYDSCLTELTKQRSARFQQYLSAEEGDLTSPLPPAN